MTCWTAGRNPARPRPCTRSCAASAVSRPAASPSRHRVIDSQLVKAAETVAKDSRGFDAGKKINGRKWYIAVDTIGLLLTVLITAVGIQDRDTARPLLRNMRRAFPAVKLSLADGGYAGKLVTWAKKALKLTVQIVRRPDDLHTFQVLPRRWVVERTLAWITRCRRTVRDYERLHRTPRDHRLLGHDHHDEPPRPEPHPPPASAARPPPAVTAARPATGRSRVISIRPWFTASYKAP